MLTEIVKGREEEIAARWIERVGETYPQETGRFLTGEPDPFANPVGRMLRDAARPLVEALTADRSDIELCAGLVDLMRLRSVQDMTAAQAVGIVPLLRDAVMDVVGDRVERAGPPAAEELSRRIERLMLVSFDAFVLSRERLYEIRIAERERHAASLLRRAGKAAGGSRAGGVGSGLESSPVR